MKIVFFGTPEFAVPSLEALAGRFDVAAVVTMPDKIGGRGNQIIESDVKKAAMRLGLPVLQPEKLRDEAFVDTLRDIAADMFVVIAFRMLPEVVWAMPPKGTFNLHASLLPRYRGAAPINRAIMNGETESGVTTFFLKHEIDTGDIIDRVRVEIGPDEDAGSLYDRLMLLGADLCVKTVQDVMLDRVHPMPQDEVTGVQPCPAPKIFKEDCKIDWNRPAAEVHNHVRGLSPYPGAWCAFSLGGAPESTLKIYATARTVHGPALGPGEITMKDGHVYAGCGDGAIELLTVQMAGKKRMDADQWYRGLRAGENGRAPRLM